MGLQDSSAGRADSANLLGRVAECADLDRVISAARIGESRALVVHGDAGVGKSALLDYVASSAQDLRILRSVGVESDMGLAFAALHQLCAPLLDRLSNIPAPQRNALETVFGVRAASTPDRFLVGLAVLSLLSDVAGERPLLCIVDDAQWLDQASAQIFGFVARRLMAESVAFLFGTRELGQELFGLPDLEVIGLGDVDARTLLAPVFQYVHDENVRSRIVAEARGNPLALLELPLGFSIEELAGRTGQRSEQPLSRHIEDSFLARVGELSDEARLLLLVAAAEPVGDPIMLWRAAERLGLDARSVSDDGLRALLTINGRVTFRHPLVRSAVYRAATSKDRNSVHLALAAVTDVRVDPDRRALHRASAAIGPDESVAEELERAAVRAQARGGLVAAAAFLQRSVALTEKIPVRVGRALTAAQVSVNAGEFDLALRMVLVAEAGATEEIQRARAMLLRGQIAFALGQGADAPRILLSAANMLRTLDPKVAREAYLQAWAAALFASDLGGETSLLAVSAAAASLPPAEDPGPPDILLEGLVTLTTMGRIAAAPLLRRAMVAFASPEASAEDGLRWSTLTGVPPCVLWDEQAWDAINSRQLALSRSAGALSRLPYDLTVMAILVAWRGDFAAASAAIAEADAVVAATNIQIAPFATMVMAALRGREAEATALFDAVAEGAAKAHQGAGVQFARWVSAVLFNGLGRYEEAFVAAREASTQAPVVYVSAWALPELIEASVRSGNAPIGKDALAQLAEAAAAADTDWARGVEARSRALLSDDDDAESFYQQAVEQLGRTEMRPELARAHLLYGEWLRRQGRRVDARAQLRTAYDSFTTVGMEAFAERARRELLATGEKVRKRAVESAPSNQLTAQEQQIALLVRDGLSNPEVGVRLFLSPRTVEWHLRKVFAKLSISSRKQLRDALPDSLRVPA